MANPLFNSRRAADALVVCLYLWLAAAMLHYVSHQAPGYDDAYNATVARNFVEGLGWSSNYHVLIPFNSTVTTGPGLLLPAALAIKLFGPDLRLPGLVNTTTMLVALALCGVLLRRLVPTPATYALLCLASLLLLSLYDHNTWAVLIGEGALAMLLTAAAALGAICVTGRRLPAAIAMGALLGLAFLTKVYALIAIAGMVGFLGWHAVFFAVDAAERKALGRQLLAMAVGAAVVVAPWLAYQHISLAELNPAELRARAEFSTQFFRYYGSGVGQWLDAPDKLEYLRQNTTDNFLIFADYLQLGGFSRVAAAAVPAVALVAALAALCRRPTSALDLLIGLLACGAAAHWAWFFFIKSGPWIHYVRIPVMLSCLLVPLLIARFVPRGAAVAAGAAVLLLILLPQPKQNAWADIMLFRNHDQTELLEQEKLIALARAQPPGTVVGCNWLVFRQLQYVLPADQQPRDCVLIIKEQLRMTPAPTQETLPAGEPAIVHFPQPITFKLVLGGYLDYTKFAIPLVTDIEPYCTRSPDPDRRYVLAECRVESLPRELALRIQEYAPLHLSGVTPPLETGGDQHASH